MSGPEITVADWTRYNERHLAGTLACLYRRLKTFADSDAGERSPQQAPTPGAQPDPEILELEQRNPPPALVLLANALGLSAFERDVLTLCAAMELDARIPALCASAQGDSDKPYPTFALAFALFDAADWSALTPHAPLRRWRMLEINQPGATALTAAALSIDERILNYVKGVNYLDDQLSWLLDPVVLPTVSDDLPPSEQQAVDDIVQHLQRNRDDAQGPLIELPGRDRFAKRHVAARAAQALGLRLQVVNLDSLPAQGGDFERFTSLWERESLLLPLALYVETGSADDSQRTALRRLLRRTGGALFIDAQEAGVDSERPRLVVETGKPDASEQAQLWTSALPAGSGDLCAHLAEQFSFHSAEIARIAASAAGNGADSGDVLSQDTLWQSCRAAARAGMDSLAQRIDARANWERMVLPVEPTTLLRKLVDQVARRGHVYRDWGFGQRMNRGLGINALFTGESGTGKSMAAEVVANSLGLDLYRIDLSAVVSKYIGETEKNLCRLFDAAQDSGAILFFDEADALFGKRSEVKDSHDRYANIEINYLLQRMESYRGLAILATNMKTALDKAFVRRLRFIIDFPFPGVEERSEIWRRVFPPETPLDSGLDFARLGKLSLAGGNIQSVALNAAFAAAGQGGPVTMPMILDAARIEYKKLERPVRDSDFSWQRPPGAAL